MRNNTNNTLSFLSYSAQHLWASLGSVENSCSLENNALQSPLGLFTRNHLVGSLLVEDVDFPPLKFGSGWFSNTFWNITNNDRFRE